MNHGPWIFLKICMERVQNRIGSTWEAETDASRLSSGCYSRRSERLGPRTRKREKEKRIIGKV